LELIRPITRNEKKIQGKPKKVLETRVKENTLKIKKCKNRMLSYNSRHK